MRTPAANATTRFSDRVEDYIRYRPHYPAAIVDHLAARHGLRPEHVIADIGSGTGILTALLLSRGHEVFGVEPNPDMRAGAERLLAGQPRFHSVAGTAEATTLPNASVDWITAGQAFHWFDGPRAHAEFARILRPRPDAERGNAALVWNERREDTPFLKAYEAFLLDFSTDYEHVKHQNAKAEGMIDEFFAPRRVELATFPNKQVFDVDGLRGRTTSSSYVPNSGHPRFAEMIEALRRLFDAHQRGGLVAVDYITQVFVGTVP